VVIKSGNKYRVEINTEKNKGMLALGHFPHFRKKQFMCLDMGALKINEFILSVFEEKKNKFRAQESP
jgi:hypothetical protein